MTAVRRTYTPDQQEIVDQYKSWAVLLTQMRGKDPERKVEMPHPTIVGATVFCQAWEVLVPELYDMEAAYLSMMATRQDRMPVEAKSMIVQ